MLAGRVVILFMSLSEFGWQGNLKASFIPFFVTRILHKIDKTMVILGCFFFLFPNARLLLMKVHYDVLTIFSKLLLKSLLIVGRIFLKLFYPFSDYWTIFLIFQIFSEYWWFYNEISFNHQAVDTTWWRSCLVLLLLCPMPSHALNYIGNATLFFIIPNIYHLPCQFWMKRNGSCSFEIRNYHGKEDI